MNEFANKVIDKIKSEKIKPRSRWDFKFRELSKWTVLGFFLIFLGLTSALLWYFLSDTNVGLKHLLRCPLAVGYGPGLIIMLLVLVILFSILGIRRIKGSYRYNILLISGLFILSGLILAIIFAHLGYGQKLDSTFSSIPLYQSQEQFIGLVWQQPDQGRIAGSIVKIESQTRFFIKDINGKEWLISALNAVWRHKLTPSVGMNIRIQGVRTGDSLFEANNIRPWMPKNKGCAVVQDSTDLNSCVIGR